MTKPTCVSPDVQREKLSRSLQTDLKAALRANVLSTAAITAIQERLQQKRSPGTPQSAGLKIAYFQGRGGLQGLAAKAITSTNVTPMGSPVAADIAPPPRMLPKPEHGSQGGEADHAPAATEGAMHAFAPLTPSDGVAAADRVDQFDAPPPTPPAADTDEAPAS